MGITINDSSFNCLDCRKRFPSDKVMSHLETTTHKHFTLFDDHEVLKCDFCFKVNARRLACVKVNECLFVSCDSCIAELDSPEAQEPSVFQMFKTYQEIRRDMYGKMTDLLSFSTKKFLKIEKRFSKRGLKVWKDDLGNFTIIKGQPKGQYYKQQISATVSKKMIGDANIKELTQDDNNLPTSEKIAEVIDDQLALETAPVESEMKTCSFKDVEKIIHKMSKKPPKLHYSTLGHYLREMSFCVYLEELFETFPSDPLIYNKSNANKYYVELDYQQEMVERLSDKMRSLKDIPFSPHQLFILANEQNVWYGYVESRWLDNADSPSRINVIVNLYNWNSKGLPRRSNDIKIFPCSYNASRILNSMDKLYQSQMKTLLIGKSAHSLTDSVNYDIDNLEFFNSAFNQYQRSAVKYALKMSVSLIRAPFGTGKTVLIVELVRQLLRMGVYPIRVVAASNLAVDNIAQLMIPQYKDDILRIVSQGVESKYRNSHQLSGVCVHNKVGKLLGDKCLEIKKKLETKKPVKPNEFKLYRRECYELSSKLASKAKVIFSTTSCADRYSDNYGYKVPVVIMDESTESSEPSCLIPLSLPGVKKAIFVGDDKQLSFFSKSKYLTLSLFERLIENNKVGEPEMLHTQFRMHPILSAFPNVHFYNGLLANGVSAEERTITSIHNPVVWWNTASLEKHSEKAITASESVVSVDGHETYDNETEADLVVKVIKKLVYEKKVKRKDIGIITPYRGQKVRIANALLKDMKVQNNKIVDISDDNEELFNDKISSTIMKLDGVEISSIDGFQGKEKKFIVLSLVRSNDKGSIGFLNDKRRTNVALTRAKFGLILVGDLTCMRKKDGTWKAYGEWLKANGRIIEGDEFTY
ncbi:hypothetical protein DASC09_006120 [Saccharomycopsis crataegensis]|uniref:C2H2-type domain-containing protein n=1 Tax=Saccharomycopsis crataegensis TaxID=43959 RepID=A0AAV5QF83_9ASCO|nr:hypothetical protein DASC09_006120 [Saccharomycopsis crataegensis]